MTMLGLRTAIVDALTTSLPTLRTCESHGGKFDLPELTRWARQAPAILVSILGVTPATQQGGQARAKSKCAAFIMVRGSSVSLRDAQALSLVETVLGHTANNLWAYSDADAPQDVRADNLYTGSLDKKAGVALWAVTWTQTADISIVDASAFDDLHDVNSKLYIPPYDGVIDSENNIEIQGTFMSAYGHIYVSTAVGTAISVAGTYQKLSGTTTLKLNDGFDMPVDGRLRHTDDVTRPILVTAGASLTVSADAKVTLALATNGVVDEATEIEEEMTSAGGVETFPLRGVFSLIQNDYNEIWVKADDTITVTATKLNMIAAAT